MKQVCVIFNGNLVVDTGWRITQKMKSKSPTTENIKLNGLTSCRVGLSSPNDHQVATSFLKFLHPSCTLHTRISKQRNKLKFPSVHQCHSCRCFNPPVWGPLYTVTLDYCVRYVDTCVLYFCIPSLVLLIHVWMKCRFQKDHAISVFQRRWLYFVCLWVHMRSFEHDCCRWGKTKPRSSETRLLP